VGGAALTVDATGVAANAAKARVGGAASPARDARRSAVAAMVGLPVVGRTDEWTYRIPVRIDGGGAAVGAAFGSRVATANLAIECARRLANAQAGALARALTAAKGRAAARVRWTLVAVGARGRANRVAVLVEDAKTTRQAALIPAAGLAIVLRVAAG
jgi:hypothetical protein